MKLDREDNIQLLIITEVKLTHQLHGQERNSLDREPKITMNEKVLKGSAEAFDHQCIEVGFGTKPVNLRNTNPPFEHRVDTKFVAKSVFSSNSLQFNDDSIFGYDIICKIYFTLLWDVSQIREWIQSPDVRDGPHAILSCILNLPAIRTSAMSYGFE